MNWRNYWYPNTRRIQTISFYSHGYSFDQIQIHKTYLRFSFFTFILLYIYKDTVSNWITLVITPDISRDSLNELTFRLAEFSMACLILTKIVYNMDHGCIFIDLFEFHWIPIIQIWIMVNQTGFISKNWLAYIDSRLSSNSIDTMANLLGWLLAQPYHARYCGCWHNHSASFPLVHSFQL